MKKDIEYQINRTKDLLVYLKNKIEQLENEIEECNNIYSYYYKQLMELQNELQRP
jgi:chaperonin cofactor prefoldin